MLGALAAGAALDPDFLKWEPGARTYFDMGAGRDWTVMTFKRGDIFTIEGRYALNPVTGKVIPGQLQSFIVTEDVHADRPDVELPYWPRFTRNGIMPKPRARDVRALYPQPRLNPNMVVRVT